MSHNKMLIDATHPEETRVVVLRNGRVEEFDFESAARKLLRGNIYLAKVTRVEPSLQAAFIDYGGNRHGFLAFTEIHPDYYTIPVADRQALLDEEAAADAEEEAEADRRAEARAAKGDDADLDEAEDQAIDVADLLPPETIEPIGAASLPLEASGSDDRVTSEVTSTAEPAEAPHEHAAEPSASFEPAAAAEASPEFADSAPNEAADESTAESAAAESAAEAKAAVESVGADDALEEVPVRPRRRMRSYKIQEVIKRRQIILVQVVKEERGTKGAALTTYLSLAGRYTVLMPNTARGGGISRKITNAQDRKRLKAIAQDLDVPEGMGLIIRTAGAARTAQEIKRDFEYLLRLWESVRDMTLQSTAPSLVYEEGDLIKRSIRDLYTKEVDEILVAGDAAHREARDFMRMLMPSHAKNVIDYREPEPLFNRYQIERQLNAMFSPYVNLKSGGYLVINQTEALVAIDINSGKSTREFSIEETALNTNLEAADEIARQLKLRDLAGLIVIDFIDMEEKRNNRAVERRIKEALRFDRARIQVGRISHFGLLEMSRQRMRTGVLEGSTTQCPHCQGTGIIRSTESVALAVIRALEDTLIANGRSSLVANTSASAALYILNHKRNFIVDMEHRHGVAIHVQASDKMHGANFTIEKSSLPLITARRPDKSAVNMDWGFNGDGEAVVEEQDEPALEAEEAVEPREARGGEEAGGDAPRGRRRRRRRGGRRDERGDRPADQAGERFADSEDDERPSRMPTGELEEIDSEAEEPQGGHRHRERPAAAVDDGGDDADGDAESNGNGVRAAERGEGGEGEGGRGRRGRRRGRRGGRRGGRDRDGLTASGNGTGQHNGDETSADGPDGGERDAVSDYEPSHDDGPALARDHDQIAEVDQSHTAGKDEFAPPVVSEPMAAAHEPVAIVETSANTPAGTAEPHRPSDSNGAAHTAAAAEPPAVEEPRAPEIKPHERPTTPPDEIAVVSTSTGDDKPARKGWWQRRLSGE